MIDTRTWDVRIVDREAADFRVAGDLLLATGSGLAAYDVTGRKQFKLFDGEPAWVATVYGRLAYVGIGPSSVLRVVDLTTGNAVGERSRTLPSLVTGAASSWWGDY